MELKRVTATRPEAPVGGQTVHHAVVLRDYLSHVVESADGLLVGDNDRRSSYE